MEAERTETVVGKAVAYVKEILRIPSGRNRMEVREDSLGSNDDTDPDDYTYKSVAEVYVEMARRDLGC
jgi:hypothetical protein